MDAEYLKLHVGDALAKGLAQVVVNQPNDGVLKQVIVLHHQLLLQIVENWTHE